MRRDCHVVAGWAVPRVDHGQRLILAITGPLSKSGAAEGLGKDRKNMATRLYVGNLSYDVTNNSLEQMFAEFGDVRSAQVVTDRDTGRSKGFGFVEYGDANAARAAIAAMNGKECGGRSLTVNEARPREERGGGGGGRSGGYGGGGRRY